MALDSLIGDGGLIGGLLDEIEISSAVLGSDDLLGDALSGDLIGHVSGTVQGVLGGNLIGNLLGGDLLGGDLLGGVLGGDLLSGVLGGDLLGDVLLRRSRMGACRGGRPVTAARPGYRVGSAERPHLRSPR